MSKFYSTEPNSGHNKGAFEGRLIWMMTGVLLAVLIMLLVYIYHSPTTGPLPTTAQSKTEAAISSAQSAYSSGENFPQHSPSISPSSSPTSITYAITPTPAPKPHFTFYKELSDSSSTQVVIEPSAQRQDVQKPVTQNTPYEVPNQDATAAALQPDVEKISTAQEQETVEQKTDEGSLTANHYLLQTGSFKSQLQADRQRAQLLLQGYNAGIRSIKLSSGHIWHRVVLGPFNKKQATSVQARLDADHIPNQLRKAN